jgi:hypothetical protein
MRKFLDNPLKIVSSILGTISVIVGIVIGVLTLTDRVSSPPRRSETSRLIIVDSSKSMARHLSPQTKFDAAMEVILNYVERESSVDVALRFASGTCREEDEGRAVDFGQENAEEVRMALRRQRARLGGNANFVDTLAMGVDDFREVEEAASAKARSIWLFLGTAKDDCHEDTVSELETAVDNHLVEVSHIDFFALRAEKTSFRRLRKRLERLSNSFRGFNVRDEDELRKIVRNAARREQPSP